MGHLWFVSSRDYQNQGIPVLPRASSSTYSSKLFNQMCLHMACDVQSNRLFWHLPGHTLPICSVHPQEKTWACLKGQVHTVCCALPYLRCWNLLDSSKNQYCEAWHCVFCLNLGDVFLETKYVSPHSRPLPRRVTKHHLLSTKHW